MVEKIRDCISRSLKLDAGVAAEVNEQTTAADLSAWTSVSHLSLILELEKAFDVQFDNQEIASLGSVSAIMQSLENKSR